MIVTDRKKENATAAVLRVLYHKHPLVKNHIIHSAHHKHKMSGLQRLRELRLYGIINYTFDRKTNTYHIKTSKIAIKRAYKIW